MNTLYYGDNLGILREHIKDESVDLIYLDPPFNSNANYNVLFKSPTGHKSHAQIEAFEDTWHWTDEAEKAFDEVMHSGNMDAAELLRAMRAFLKENDMMLELRRVLKETGSLYLHCDTTASHYLKLILDSIFEHQNFRSEIIWKRTSSHGNVSVGYGAVTDSLFLYSRGPKPKWNQIYIPYTSKHIETKFTYKEPDGRLYTTENLRNPGVRPNLTYEYKGYQPHPNGWAISREKMEQYDKEGRLYFPKDKDGRIRLKRYLDDQPGHKLQSLWDDISPINSQAQERLGYPTQKPLALLERVIAASSNEEDIVLDPFCGCETTIHAAQKLNRQWIGIDITNLAISRIEKRLIDAFPGVKFDVLGTPKDLEGARALATKDKYQFQWWAVSLVKAVPYGEKKKGADSGIDGFIYFKPDARTTEKAIVSVKGGDNVNVAMVRDLAHVVAREKGKIGIFITLAEATKPMLVEAVKEGLYETLYGKFPKLQILTIEQLLEGKQPHIPWVDPATFKKAAREASGSDQDELPF